MTTGVPGERRTVLAAAGSLRSVAAADADRGWFFLPIVAAVAGHARSLRGDFVWDDALAVENSIAAGIGGGVAGLSEYYRPLCTLLGSLIVAAGGADRPWMWHLVNVAIHVGTTAAVYRLLRSWTASPAPHAALGATLFALWPTGVDAVSWVSASTELLMGFFVVWGLVFQMRARDRGGFAVGAALLHLGALLSKEVGIVFLPLAVAVTFLAPSPAGTRPRWVRMFGPHIAVLVVYTLLRSTSVGPGASLLALAADRLRPEALAPALYALGWYARESLLLGTGAPYVESPVASAVTWGFALAALFVFAKALDVSRRPEGRPWALAAVWFFLALGPPLAFASAPISVTPIALRYLYLPVVGLCAAVTLALARVPSTAGSPRVRVAAACVVIAFLAVCGWGRQTPWLSDVALWTRAARDNPHSSIVQLNLGLAKIVAGDVRPGEEHLRASAWNPALADGPTRQSMLVRVGEYYMQTGQSDRAREAFTLAARMQGSPSTAARAAASAVSLDLLGSAHVEDGAIRLSRQDAKRQLAVLEHAAAIDPRDTTSRLVLALLDEAFGEPVRAMARHEEIARASRGRPERRDASLASAARLREVIAGDPDPVRRTYYQAQLHDLRGEADDAVRSYREVLASDPDRPEIHLAIADVLSRAGRSAEAMQALEIATRLVPRDPTVWYNLGIEQHKAANAAGAADSFGRAIEAAPDWWKPYLPRGIAQESTGDAPGAVLTYEAFLARFEEPADVRETIAQRLRELRASMR